MTSIIDRRGLVTFIDGEAHLVGARCEACDTHTFPAQSACPRCGAGTAEVALPRSARSGAGRCSASRPSRRSEGPTSSSRSPSGTSTSGRCGSRPGSRAEPGRARGRSATTCSSSPGQPDDDGDVWSYRSCRRYSRRAAMTVPIVGVGLHPFGRFEISGREMGLIAARERARRRRRHVERRRLRRRR